MPPILSLRLKVPHASAGTAPSIAALYFRRICLAIIFALLLQAPNEAMAMRCSLPAAAVILKESEFIFVGTAISVEPIKESSSKSDVCWVWSPEKKNCGSKRVKFKVSKPIKGLKEGEITTFLAGDGCYCSGGYVEKGEKRLVFAKRGQKDQVELQQISHCLGMKPADGKLFDEIQTAASGKKTETGIEKN